MTPARVTLALVLVMVAVLLAAGCVGQQKSDSVYTVQQEKLDKSVPFDFIKMDSFTYNVGEVVEFTVVNESRGKGKCSDHPCSYRVARQAENSPWKVLPGPIVTKLPHFDMPYYESSCQPMHFATTNWEPGSTGFNILVAFTRNLQSVMCQK